MKKIWRKTYSGTKQEYDIHGEPLIEKYATESDVVTVTAGIMRITSYPGTSAVKYSKKAIDNLHNHH